MSPTSSEGGNRSCFRNVYVVLNTERWRKSKNAVIHRGDVWCAQNMENKEKRFIDAMNVKQACVWMDVSRAITQISTSNLVAFLIHIQAVQLKQ
jgi:hypothetical protein